MRHWQGSLRIPIMEVNYEKLVADFEPQCRSLIEFCGLEWDERCLSFHTAKRAVGTYSYDQVGNRTDLSGSYLNGNRITAFNGCSYATDTDGNVTSRSCGGQGTTFTWSAENRLTSYSVSDGPTVTMDYDAGGRLSRRISSAAGTTWVRPRAWRSRRAGLIPWWPRP
jgi:YD repeat-containing protein